LLEELGYAIDFNHDALSGEAVEAGLEYVFVAETGFVARGLQSPRERINLYSGHDLLCLGRGEFTQPDARRAAKKILRQALAPLLGDKPLNSRMLYRPADALPRA
jgi:DNA repair protein RecO (recombination protein O)